MLNDIPNARPGSAFNKPGGAQAFDQRDKRSVFLQLIFGGSIGSDLHFKIIKTRHAIVIQALDSAFTRVLYENERLGDIPKIVAALVIVAHKVPVQVEADSARAGFNSTLSPQPHAEV